MEKSCGLILTAETGGRFSSREPHFLLLRSARWGEWGPPKGHVEEGESEVETAVRELYEECGLSSVRFTPGFRHVVEYFVRRDGKKNRKQAVYFMTRVVAEPEIRLSDEHVDYFWATPDEVETLVPHENLREVFRAAHKRLQEEKAAAEKKEPGR